MFVDDAGSPSPCGASCDAPDAAARERRIVALAEQFTHVAVQLSLLQVEQVDLVRQLLAQQGAIAGSVANWLSLRAGLSTSEAKQLCRVAQRLGERPLIDAAFRAGRLSLDTADVLLKVATVQNEAVLLETAGAATGAQLRKIIAAYRRVRRHGEPEENRDEVVGYGGDESMWTLHARLRAEHGGEIESVLRAAREDLWATHDATAGGDGAGRSVSSTEALLHVFRSYLEAKVNGAGQLPERFLTIVHVDLTGDGAASHGPNDVASVRGGGPVDGPTLGRVLCDSLVAVVRRRGVDVRATAPVRLATAAQRQALHAMHRTCQFPGCGRTRYLQAHHTTPHPDGPTALGNLALLCDQHHTQVHQPGWTATLTDDHVLVVHTAHGTPLTAGALRPTPTAAGPPGRTAVDRAAEIAKTATTAAATVDVGRRLRGTGDRLDLWALDVTLHAWLEAAA